jgi:hypothetical protein
LSVFIVIVKHLSDLFIASYLGRKGFWENKSTLISKLAMIIMYLIGLILISINLISIKKSVMQRHWFTEGCFVSPPGQKCTIARWFLTATRLIGKDQVFD